MGEVKTEINDMKCSVTATDAKVDEVHKKLCNDMNSIKEELKENLGAEVRQLSENTK